VNPFGQKEYGADSGPGGPYTLEQGKSFTLAYRVLLHLGDEKAGHVAEAFAEYAKTEVGR